eukprot:6810930-Pyramimonas_sp.AAC.1
MRTSLPGGGTCIKAGACHCGETSPLREGTAHGRRGPGGPSARDVFSSPDACLWAAKGITKTMVAPANAS